MKNLDRYPFTVALTEQWDLEDKLKAVAQALDYDLSDLSNEEHRLGGAAARLYSANFKAWKLAK